MASQQPWPSAVDASDPISSGALHVIARTNASAPRGPAGPYVAPPMAHPGAGSGQWDEPYRVTLISAVALVGAGVSLLTCFYLLRAYQQVRRL